MCAPTWRRTSRLVASRTPLTCRFSRALERRRAEGVPEIQLYVKDIAAELLEDPGRQLEQVLAFRQRVQANGELLYRTSPDTATFATTLSDVVVAHLIDINGARTAVRAETLRRKADAAGDDGRDAAEAAFAVEEMKYLLARATGVRVWCGHPGGSSPRRPSTPGSRAHRRQGGPGGAGPGRLRRAGAVLGGRAARVARRPAHRRDVRRVGTAMATAQAPRWPRRRHGWWPGRRRARQRAGSTATGSRCASWWLVVFGTARAAFVRSSKEASDSAPLPASTVSSASSQCS